MDELERKTSSHFQPGIASETVTEELKQEVISLYQPKKIEFTAQKTFYKNNFEIAGNTLNLNGVRNMYYSMSSVTKLRNKYQEETSSNYDLVIMTRPDVLLRQPFPIDIFVERAKASRFRNCIFSAPFLRSGAMRSNKLRVFDEKAPACDVLFMGQQENMNVFSKISDTDDFYLIDDYAHSKGRAEPIFSNFLIANNLSMKFITYFGPKNWKIQREFEYKRNKDLIEDSMDEFNQSRKYFSMAIKSLLGTLKKNKLD